MKNVYYHLSHYISHRTAGQAYMDALRAQGVPLAATPDDADVLILHDDPLNLPGLIRKYTGRKHIIAYCVWEADILPQPYLDSLQGIDRLWTCTPYSARPFQRAGLGPVDIVPHIVNPPRPTRADMETVKDRIGFRDDGFYLYTVADSVNPRKNLKALLQAFTTTFRGQTHVRLVVKQYRHPWDLGSLDNVIGIDAQLAPGEMSALHDVCHCHVSAHHAEAWGLSISDAMSAGNPVIATGFSGNMYYMTDANSFPVNFQLTHISDEMCGMVPLFTPDMTWADIDARHLSYLMRKVSQGKYDPGVPRNATRAMQPFGSREIGATMRKLLETLEP